MTTRGDPPDWELGSRLINPYVSKRLVRSISSDVSSGKWILDLELGPSDL